jgi:broad specificity phosphatase PhoE
MELLLIRHGESKTITQSRHQTFDDPLTDEGRAKLFVVQDEFDSVFSSDMPRAIETAKIIFPNHNIIIDERLREKRNGVFEGMQKQDVDWSEVNKTPFMLRKALHGEE